MNLEAEYSAQLATVRIGLLNFQDVSAKELSLVDLGLAAGMSWTLRMINAGATMEQFVQLMQSQTIACKHKVDQMEAKRMEMTDGPAS